MANKLPLRLLIDTKTNNVLFAEAGKEVVDFLFSLLALPMGTIVKLVSKEQMVSCIGGLYSSLEQLEESYLLSEKKKSTLLNPPVFSSPISKDTLLPPAPVTSKKYCYRYKCARKYGPCYASNEYKTRCPMCNTEIDQELKLVGSKKEEEKEEGGVGLVKGVVTYSIMDGLSVVPMPTISSIITLISKFQIKDLGSLKEKNVELGNEEGLELLKASLQCKNVLTAAFLAGKQQVM